MIPCCSLWGRIRSTTARLALTAMLLGPAGVGSAFAADPAEVENIIRQGNELRQKGRDAAALPLFQRAYDLERSPRTAAQLGLVESAMGYWLASERHLMEALSAPRHPFVNRHYDELQQTLKGVRGSIGEVEVVGAPAGAEILINGKAEGMAPLDKPLRANEGVVQVAVRAPGFEDTNTSVQVMGGKLQRVTVALVPSAGVAAAAARSRTGNGKVDASATIAAGKTRRGRSGEMTLQEGAPPPEPAGSGAPGWVRPVAWVSGGLALVGLSVGTAGYLAMKSSGEDFNNRKKPGTNIPECYGNAADKGGPKCKAIYDAAVSNQRLAINGFAAGGLLLAGSIIGFLWSADRHDEASASEGTASGGPVASFDASGFYAGWHARF